MQSSSSVVAATHFFTRLFLHLFLVLATAAGSSPLDHLLKNNGWPICDGPSNNNSTTTDLNLLFASLSKNTPRTGFYNATSNSNSSSYYKYYGLGLCRGDVKGEECQPCIDNAVKDLIQYCPDKLAATVWYDDCLLRYADADFFAVPTGYQTALYNSDEVKPEFKTRFDEVLIGLLNRLARQAAFRTSRMFLTGEAEIGTSMSSAEKKIYGLVQCTRDLSRGDCYLCLKDEIRYSQSGKIGARFLGGSCWVRYESALFYNVVVPSSGSGGRKAAPASNNN